MADLQLRLDIDADGYVDGSKKAEKSINRVDKATRKADRSIDRLGKTSKTSLNKTAAASEFAKGKIVAMAAGAVALASVISGKSIKAFIAYEKELIQVSTLLDGGAKQMAKVESAIKSLTREFGGAAKDQAAAYYSAVSSGAEAGAAAVDVLTISNKAAVAGGAEILPTLDLITTAMNSYASSSLTASEASDSLFLAIKFGKTTMNELSSNLGRVTARASAAGIEFDELTSAFSVLTFGGIKSAEATTQLGAIFTSLSKPSGEAKKLAKELGIQFDAEAISVKGLLGFIKELAAVTGGSQTLLTELFGSSEAANAATVLIAQVGKLESVLGEMENKIGTTQTAFEKMADTMGYRLNIEMGKFNVKLIEVGVQLTSVFVPTLEFFNTNSALVLGIGATGAALAIAFGVITGPLAIIAGFAAIGLAAAGVATEVYDFTNQTKRAKEAADALGDSFVLVDDVRLTKIQKELRLVEEKIQGVTEKLKTLYANNVDSSALQDRLTNRTGGEIGARYGIDSRPSFDSDVIKANRKRQENQQIANVFARNKLEEEYKTLLDEVRASNNATDPQNIKNIKQLETISQKIILIRKEAVENVKLGRTYIELSKNKQALLDQNEEDFDNIYDIFAPRMDGKLEVTKDSVTGVARLFDDLYKSSLEASGVIEKIFLSNYLDLFGNIDKNLIQIDEIDQKLSALTEPVLGTQQYKEHNDELERQLVILEKLKKSISQPDGTFSLSIVNGEDFTTDSETGVRSKVPYKLNIDADFNAKELASRNTRNLSIRKEIDALTAAITPAKTALQQYASDLKDVAYAHEVGAISAGRQIELETLLLNNLQKNFKPKLDALKAQADPKGFGRQQKINDINDTIRNSILADSIGSQAGIDLSVKLIDQLDKEFDASNVGIEVDVDFVADFDSLRASVDAEFAKGKAIADAKLLGADAIKQNAALPSGDKNKRDSNFYNQKILDRDKNATKFTGSLAPAAQSVADFFNPKVDILSFEQQVAKTLQDNQDSINGVTAAFERGKGAAADFFVSATNDTISLTDAIDNLAKTFRNKLLKQGFLDILSSGFGQKYAGKGTFGGDILKTIFSAKGNAFESGQVIPFAKGGVLNSQISFPLAGNNIGIAGEGGKPEAIIPLKRGKSGNLGVELTQTASDPVSVAISYQIDARGTNNEAVQRIERNMIENKANLSSDIIDTIHKARRDRKI